MHYSCIFYITLLCSADTSIQSDMCLVLGINYHYLCGCIWIESSYVARIQLPGLNTFLETVLVIPNLLLTMQSNISLCTHTHLTVSSFLGEENKLVCLEQIKIHFIFHL